jgi:2-oxoglutarate ferredoxin oxidoreductase subunit alpha
VSEDPDNRVAQVDKRMRKLDGMVEEIEGPEWYGPPEADLTLVEWGSTYGPAREAVDRLNAEQPGRANLLHFSMVTPFPSQAAEALAKVQRAVVVEQNATGQLETLIRAQTLQAMDGSIRKYDGRAFTPEYILAHLPEEV